MNNDNQTLERELIEQRTANRFLSTENGKCRAELAAANRKNAETTQWLADACQELIAAKAEAEVNLAKANSIVKALGDVTEERERLWSALHDSLMVAIDEAARLGEYSTWLEERVRKSLLAAIHKAKPALKLSEDPTPTTTTPTPCNSPTANIPS